MAQQKCYQKWLLEKLRDKEQAFAYLNVAYEESLSGEPEALHLFQTAKRNVAQASGGEKTLAQWNNLPH
ncbi:MAG: hypothetical protein S4CHLAM102_08300 [Chlamydiia bacterium]|nr:hypothetical protein [Chlamydiia bacterium]